MIVLLASLLCACSGASTQMPNPLVSGAVASNTIVVSNAATENRYRLDSGSLDDTASLTQLDATTACFRTSLAAVPGETDERLGDGFYDVTLELDGSTLQPSRHEPEPVREVSVGSYEADPNTEGYRAAQATVVRRDALVCFDHAGAIDAQTTELDLRMVEPTTGPSSTLGGITFSWDFPDPNRNSGGGLRGP